MCTGLSGLGFSAQYLGVDYKSEDISVETPQECIR